MTLTAEPVVIEPGEQPAVAEPQRRRRWFRPWRIAGLALTMALVGVVAFLAWLLWGLPEINLDKPAGESVALVLEAADGSPIARSGGRYSGPLTREELPDHMVKAVLAIEDRRFYEHDGVDPFSIVRAAWRNFRAGDIVQGGSTITQQLAKILFLGPEKTYRRKLQEAVIATWMDTHLSKDEILVKYLDSVYFGAGATGLNAAAEAYFGREVSELDVAQSAMLAGLIRAPSRLNPLNNPEEAQERTTLVLQSMVEAGFLEREEAIAAALDPAAPLPTAAVAPTGSWFGDWIHAEAVEAIGPLGGAARIRTTLEPALQSLGERVVRAALERAGAEQNVDQAALVALNHDGAVLAMVGGRSYEESQFNRAVDARRQAGSAFKTFVYLAALRAGMTPETTVRDEPVDIGGWRPKNYSGRYHGEVTLEQALSRSMNAATVHLASQVGIDAVIHAARDLGVDAQLEPNMTLALGTAGIGLLDLTGAYASIAAGRTPIQPWGIAGVSTGPETEPVMFERDRSNRRRLDHADEMVRMLTTVVKEGTGKRAAIDGFVAGKTGTSQEHRDGWFVGFTDTLVVGVWVGNDDNSPTKEVTGGGLPAEIWREFVTKAMGLAPLEAVPQDEEVPDGPPVAEEDAEAERDVAEDAIVAPEEEVAAAEESAQDEPPLEDPAAEAAASPEEEAVAVEEPTEEAPVEEEPTEEELAAEEPPAEEPAADEATAEELVAEEPAPEQTPVETQEEAVAEAPQEAPRLITDPDEIRATLSRNRAVAEDYVARKRSGRDDGPQILLGGAGLH
jgi:1A family penicillin-binding protein